MALDDGAQIDPATLPENVELMREIDEQIAQAEAQRARRAAMAARIAAVVPRAVSKLEARVLARGGQYAKEEDLRNGVAEALRERGELVLMEAKLPVPGWSSNLGGFDLAFVADDCLAVAETKWADGNLRECMWDILKLAGALELPRIAAGVAIYGAPIKQWQRPMTCAQLLEDRVVLTRDLLEGLPEDWAANLAGSTARPNAIPLVVNLQILNATPVTVLGREWEVRTLRVTGEGGTYDLENGWPHGTPPSVPKPYAW